MCCKRWLARVTKPRPVRLVAGCCDQCYSGAAHCHHTYGFCRSLQMVLGPFLAASVVTFYLVSKMQEMGVRSEKYAKDPKNSNGVQIAKEAHP
ncbi:hypothetical protein P692DRAFT_2064641 [Suillus brevipes Sb2]|nr:hypothetical protein P692DRAFT_2064641 [Suillus brevipes Sb2]